MEFFCDATKLSSTVYAVYEYDSLRRSALPGATITNLGKAKPNMRSWVYCI